MAKPLGDLVIRALPDEAFDMVTAVPLHWWKHWRRGFNQAELLAREIGRRRGLPVRVLLRRRLTTQSQAGLANRERRRNVASAFRVRARVAGGGLVCGRRILLIDDVMTTGSTAAACAAELKRAGAARVALLTLARVDRRWDGGYPAPQTNEEG